MITEPVPTSITPASTPKIDTLTSLRFFAAIAIVIHHLRDFGFSSPLLRGLPLDNGVSFFFILSGFVMYLVYGGLRGTAARKSYLIARVSRIYPLHWVTFILLFILLDGDPGSFGTQVNPPLAGLLNVLLLQSWVPIQSFFASFNGVSWTISVEMFFYVMFIFLVVRFERNWHLKLAASAVPLIGLCALNDTLGLDAKQLPLDEVSTIGLIVYNPLARLFEFVLGMCTALLFIKLSREWRPSRSVATLIEIVVVGLFACTARLVEPMAMWTFTHVSPSAGIWVLRGGGLCLLTSLLILAFAFQAGFVSEFLRIKPLVLLGEISFSIYLVHQILLRSFAVHVDWFQELSPKATIAVYFAVLLMASALLWRFIEVPARGLLRKAYSQRVTKARRSAGDTATTAT